MTRPKRPCKTHTGPKGGKYHIQRKKGGGTKKVYVSKKSNKRRKRK